MQKPTTHLAFSLSRHDIRDRVLIPKYYDPDLKEADLLASHDCRLVELKDLLYPGSLGSHLGSWIRREWYGTGPIPYVRTSDLSHWRVRPDYKKGVADEIYLNLKEKQDVRTNDILFVAHGTYLVGNVAIVTDEEPKLLIQDHIFRLRVNPQAGLSPFYLLAALSTAFVRRQVRARQFSADIIDKIGERHLSIRVPVPKKDYLIEEVTSLVQRLIQDQSKIRRDIRQCADLQRRMLRERATSRFAFGVQRSQIRRRVLVPKYYDPMVEEAVLRTQAEAHEKWTTLGDIEDHEEISLQTGVEVGKMAYGTGEIPFIRTSDIADLEVKRDIRHGISDAIYKRFEKKAGVCAGDILLVRDGTYLVGSSVLVTGEDMPALICGGLYRIRVSRYSSIKPSALLVALNLPVVRMQMRARQFTRDVIDTLGDRIREIMVPPIGSPRWEKIGCEMDAIIARKSAIKQEIDRAIRSIEPQAPSIIIGRPSWAMR